MKHKIDDAYKCYVCKYPTTDDWYSTFPNGTVEIHVTLNPGKTYKDKNRKQDLPCVIVSFWGNDDFYLTKKITCESLKKAEELYAEKLKWIEFDLPNPVTQDWLRNQGFGKE